MDGASKASTPTELVTEILILALGMRGRARDAQFCCVHQGALKLFDEFESRAKMERMNPDDVADIKYALAAFLDEVVLTADWPGREEWADDPLQLHYFGTYLAGEGFFEKLDTLRSQVKARPEVLTIYYQCLLLGFKGKYGVTGQESLDALKKVVGSELERKQALNPNELCPHWEATDRPVPPADKIPRWFVYACVAVVAVCVLSYAVFFFTLRTGMESLQQSQTAAHFVQPERSAGGAVH